MAKFWILIPEKDFKKLSKEELEEKYKAEERRVMEKLMQVQRFSDELVLMHFRHLRRLYDEIESRKDSRV
jgi:hypothetical protein